MIPARQGRQSTARESTVILAIAVVALWAGIVAFVFLRQPVLGGDFMEFYVFGALARAGDWAQQYDWTRFHELQVALVPGSAPHFYAPAYPPLVPLLYLPVAPLPFTTAFAAWAIGSGAIYLTLIDILGRRLVSLPRAHALLGALLFPGFIAVIVLGQTTIWPLIGFVLAFHRLTTARPFAAGLCLAIVAVKPHFGIAMAFVLLLTGAWRVVAGAVTGVVLLAAATLVVCGRVAIDAYLKATLFALANPAALEPVDARHTHSVHAILTAGLPQPFVTPVWLLWAVAVVFVTAKIWKHTEAWPVRFTALLLATLLVSPHVLVYDSVLLAPALVWLFDHAATTRNRWVSGVAAILAIAFVLPAARVSFIPLSVPLMIGLLAYCWRWAADESRRG